MVSSNLIQTLQDFELGSNMLPEVLDKTLAYYFRQCSWSDVRETILAIDEDFNLAEFKRNIRVDYHFMCLKMAITDMRVNKTPIDDAMKRNEVRPVDRPVLEMAPSLPFFSNIDENTEYKTPKEIRSMTVDILKACKPNTKFFIWKKLRFLTMGGSHSPEDFMADFQARQIHLIYMHYPVLSGLYLTNTIKSDIINYGTNTIAYWTSGKRQDMHEEDGVYRFREESMEFHDNDAPSDLADENDAYERILNKHTLQSLLQRERGKKLQFLKFMAFEHPDQEDLFVARYKDKSDKKESDKREETTCQDIYNRIGPDQYFSLVSSFLTIPAYVVESVRKMIAEEITRD